MANALISIRLAQNMQEQLNELTVERGFLSPQELVRDLIRKEILKQQAMQIVSANAGFAKGRKIPTQKEMNSDVVTKYLKKKAHK